MVLVDPNLGSRTIATSSSSGLVLTRELPVVGDFATPMTNERFGRTKNTAAQFKPRRKNMKLLETWQIREAMKYAGGPYDDQYMEWLTRALNYFTYCRAPTASSRFSFESAQERSDTIRDSHFEHRFDTRVFVIRDEGWA
jgi:hypothetical protein